MGCCGFSPSCKDLLLNMIILQMQKKKEKTILKMKPVNFKQIHCKNSAWYCVILSSNVLQRHLLFQVLQNSCWESSRKEVTVAFKRGRKLALPLSVMEFE